MRTENEGSVESEAESDQPQYPFGISSRLWFVVVVVVGLIGPGLLVYALEKVSLSAIGDLVWIVGYGTTVFVVWFFWIRPLDMVGSSGQETSHNEEPDHSETERDVRDDESDPPDTGEAPPQDEPSPGQNTSQEST